MKLLIRASLLTLTFAATAHAAPVKTLSDAELSNIVLRSYAYVAMYNTLNNFALNDKNPFSTHGWNKTFKPTDLTDQSVIAITEPTLHVISALDLRAEPVIISYPVFQAKNASVETSAYDINCDIALATNKGDFKQPTRVLYYSENTKGYRGQPIAGVDKIMKMSGDFATSFMRVTPQSNDAAAYAANMQGIAGLQLQTLSEFKGMPAKAVPAVTFPAYNSGLKAFTNNFAEVMQFAVNHSHFNAQDAMDRELLAALKPIGIVPGKPFNPKQVTPIDPVQMERIVRQVAAQNRPSSQVARGKYCPQDPLSLEAMVSQDTYISGQTVYLDIDSSDGQPLTAQHDYVIRMTRDQLPPAQLNWSVSLYDGEKFLHIPNPQKKYSVGEIEGMKLNQKGGIEIYIAVQKPVGVLAENWLPINRGNTILIPRLIVHSPDMNKIVSYIKPKAERIDQK